MAFQRMYRIDLETLYPGDTSKFHFVIVLELDTHLLEKNRTSVVVCERFIPHDVAINIRIKTNRRIEILDLQFIFFPNFFFIF